MTWITTGSYIDKGFIENRINKDRILILRQSFGSSSLPSEQSLLKIDKLFQLFKSKWDYRAPSQTQFLGTHCELTVEFIQRTWVELQLKPILDKKRNWKCLRIFQLTAILWMFITSINTISFNKNTEMSYTFQT